MWLFTFDFAWASEDDDELAATNTICDVTKCRMCVNKSFRACINNFNPANH